MPLCKGSEEARRATDVAPARKALVPIAIATLLVLANLGLPSASSLLILAISLAPLTALLWVASIPIVWLGLALYVDVRRGDQLKAPRPVLRPPAFATPRGWRRLENDFERRRKTDLASRPSLFDAAALSSQLDSLLALVVRDFVSAWHGPLTSGGDAALAPPSRETSSDLDPASEFPDAVQETLRSTVRSLAPRLVRLDLSDLGVRKVLPLVTTHLEAFHRAELSTKAVGLSSPATPLSASSAIGSTAKHDAASDFEATEGREGELLLAARYEGRLHPALGHSASLDTRLSEQAHLRRLAARLLNALLPDCDKASSAVFVVAREIVACTVLMPVVDALSDPDTLNGLLEEKAGAAIEEQKLIGRLRAALETEQLRSDDAQAGSRAARKVREGEASVSGPLKPTKKTAKSFNAFLRGLEESSSLLDLRRTKNDLVQQSRKTNTALEELRRTSPSASDAKSMQRYAERLATALQVVEQRIRVLQAGDTHDSPRPRSSSTRISVSLKDVLVSPSAISHLLEWLEPRGGGIKVQFWLTVESFKGPLEELLEGEDAAGGEALKGQAASEDEIQTLAQDLGLFCEHYFPAMDVRPRFVAEAQRFLALCEGDSSASRISAWDVQAARQAVLAAQRQVLEEMIEEEWPAFAASPAYLKACDDVAREREQSQAERSASYVVQSPSLAGDEGFTAATLQPKSNLASATARHADLFGGAGDISGTSESSLFGDEAHTSRLEGSRRSGPLAHKLDYLMGGKGSTWNGDGRAPLFREALFDEDAEQDDRDEDDERPSTLRADRLDVLTHALTSIIDNDEERKNAEGETPARQTPRSGKNSRTSSSLRPAFRRSTGSSPGSTPAKDGGHRKAAFGGEDSKENFSEEPDEPTRSDVPASQALSLVDINVELSRTEAKLERLRTQQETLSALHRKAELTGASEKELRLLDLSCRAVARETRELEWERAQLEERREASTLVPGRTVVGIESTAIGHEADGKEYGLYNIEVKQLGPGEGEVVRGWVVSRRYNEFYEVHSRLRARVAEVRALESLFPGKRLVGLVHAPFVDARKAALDRYLKALVAIPAACQSPELQAFLSQTRASVPNAVLDAAAASSAEDRRAGSTSFAPLAAGQGLVRSFLKGVTGVAEGIDDMLFGPSMLDVMTGRLSTSAASLVAGAPPGELERISSALLRSSGAVATQAQIREASDVTKRAFVQPLVDFLIEIFELKEKNNWLRRQALVLVLQQALGETVERKLRETVKSLLTPSALAKHIEGLTSTMWPSGKLRGPSKPRSQAEKARLKESANKKLSTLLPSVAESFIGRENARRGARRIFSVLQNKRLNKHIIFSVLDVVFDEVFPESAGGGQ